MKIEVKSLSYTQFGSFLVAILSAKIVEVKKNNFIFEKMIKQCFVLRESCNIWGFHLANFFLKGAVSLFEKLSLRSCDAVNSREAWYSSLNFIHPNVLGLDYIIVYRI